MEKLILTDKLWQGFIGQAYTENLLTIPKAELRETDSVLRMHKSSRHKKEALTLFLLYDQTILTNDHLSFSSPALEAENHILLCEQPEILLDIFKHTDWYDIRDPAAFAKGMELVVESKEFIVPWAVEQKHQLFCEIAKELKLSRIELITNFIDYAHQYFTLNASPENHAFSQMVGSEIADIFCEKFQAATPDKEALHSVDAILFGLMVKAERIFEAKRLSIEHGAPAAGKVTSDGRYALNSKTNPSSPNTLFSDFHVVRQAFEDADLSIPIPESIKSALAMKQDPNFKPFQEQLRLFQQKFANGQIKDSHEILLEIKKARKHLRYSGELTKGMRLVTYSSIPTAILESLLLGGIPAISMTATVLSTAAQTFNDVAQKKNNWVLFGK